MTITKKERIKIVHRARIQASTYNHAHFHCHGDRLVQIEQALRIHDRSALAVPCTPQRRYLYLLPFFVKLGNVVSETPK